MATRNQTLRLLLLYAAITISFALPANLGINANNAVTKRESANINTLFDMLLPELRIQVIKDGMDPFRVDDMTQKLDGVLVHDGTLKLTKGWLQGLSEMKRFRDATMSYENMVLKMDLSLMFDTFDINYEYNFNYGLITRKGDFYARVSNVAMLASLSVDMQKHKILVDGMKVEKLGSLDVSLEGHVVDPVLNAAIKVFTTLFQSEMVNIIEKESIVIFKQLAKKIESEIPPPDKLQNVVNDIFKGVPKTLTLHRV